MKTQHILPTYGGWSNKPTWDINLWLMNEQETERTVRAMVSAAQDVYNLAHALQEYCEELCEPTVSRATMAGDLLGWALAYVDWKELADIYIEAYKGDENEKSTM